MKQKRCLTIQDYSCMGRCSLTVALPILSACGVEAVGLPTAVLSNHTAFASWTYCDLSSYMIESVEKWADYNHHFDCIYTGYLGTEQIKSVISIINYLREKDTMVMVDPAFADNGNMYPGFEVNHINEMRKLIAESDMICPNLTEAALIAGVEYQGEEYDKNYINSLLEKLAALGPKIILLTGVVLENNSIGCIIYDKEKDTTEIYRTECYPGKYHGAGDSFCSAFVGAYLRGISLYDSVKIAHDFVHRAMGVDVENGIDGIQYGLQFETVLPDLIDDLRNKTK